MKTYLFIFAASMVASTLLTWVVRELSRRFGILRKPDTSHHIHNQPIPRVGGVAVFLTFCCSLLLLQLGSGSGLFPSPLGRDPLKILPPAILLFFTGLLDDFKTLRARTKLLAQICGALWLCWGGLCFPEFNLQIAGIYFGHALSLVMTVCWVVWVCNGINFIDGLDGLAAGTSFLLAIPIFVVALLTGKAVVAMATAALVGALAGFLTFNFNPATIFLGDSGSLFLGFVLSGLVLAEAKNGAANFRNLVIPLVAFALPLTDTVLSVLRRILSGRALFSPDRKHIHHKLLDKGFTQRQAVVILYGVTAASTALSLLLLPRFGAVSVGAGGIGLVMLLAGVRQLRYQELEEIRDVGKALRRYGRRSESTLDAYMRVEELSTADSLIQLTAIVETCLLQDFSGFELILSPRFSKVTVGGIPKEAVFRRFWGSGSAHTVTFTCEVSTPQLGRLGSFKVYHDRNAPLLIDVPVVAEKLRGALSLVLSRFLADAQNKMERMRKFAPSRLDEIDESSETAGPAVLASD